MMAPIMKRIRFWARALARPGAVEQELNEEIRHHAALDPARVLRD